MLLGGTVKNIRAIGRIRELAKVLIKYGFEDIIVNTPLRNVIPNKTQVNWRRSDKSVFEYSRWERTRMVVEELGPTFIKFAQVLSNRPDVMPAQLIEEFEKLQDRVPPAPFQTVKETIESETGKPLDQTFAFFEERALGSASIGQVHRAKMLDGLEVVVKVQRAGVAKQIRMDLTILKEVVRLTENYLRSSGILNPMEIINAFEKSMEKELDYKTEARSIERFRKVYAEEENLVIPIAYKKLTTTKMLVMEFMGGCKINDVEQLKAWGLKPEDVAVSGMKIYMKQIFELGFFHADPHPGNVLVKPDGSIVLLDFGMVGTLTREQKYAFANVFVSMAQQDARGMAINLRRLATDGDVDHLKALENDLNQLIEDFVILGDEYTEMADITARLQKIIYRYQLSVPGVIFLILRALAILEGIGKQLYPEFDTLEFIKPYGKTLIKEQFSLKNISLDAYYSLTQLFSLVYNFPNEFRSIIRKLGSGRLHIHIEHHGYQPLLRTLDAGINRLALSIIIGAIVLGTSIMVSGETVQGEENILGVSITGIIGFSVAGFLGIILFFQSLGNGRH